jgi:NADH:ubiquinone oxidoreductase subunit 3 (subunit A)
MNNIILSPPIAFLAYVVLVGVLNLLGRFLAGPTKTTPLKTSTYASGEAPPTIPAAPGYRPFFVVALFFAILHLGVLVLGTSGFTGVPGIYLVGLLIALVALLLG